MKKINSIKKYTNKDLASINAISKFYGISKGISTLFYNRGIDTDEKIEKYLKKEYNLDSPLKFPTIKKAIKRINKALISDEKIVIFGDYDVDGMIATSMIYLYLSRINANVDYYIPDRKTDGYGFNKITIKKLKEEYNPDLIISVDTGITAKDEIEELKKSNIDVIITDHHTVQPDKIPNAIAVINPKFITKDENNLQDLSGGGVAFYFLRAINSTLFSKEKRQKMIDYLVLAMITSISDMMKLKGDNRLIVEYGIEYLFETELTGLNLLLDSINFYEYPTAMDIGQQLTPVINSAGRIGNPNNIIELLTDSTLNTYENVSNLISLNKERKELSKNYYKEAEILVQEQINNKIIILNDEEYNLGLIGLLATRFCYDLEKPTMVIGGVGDDGKRKVSMRSLKGIELTPLLEVLKDKIQGGGHDFALGFSLNQEDVEFVIEKVKEYIQDKEITYSTSHEIELDVSEIDEVFLKLLYRMEPFGKENERPIIKINNVDKIKQAKVLKKEHFKIDTEIISGICFFPKEELFSKYEQISTSNEKFSLIGEVYSTGDKLKIFIKDIEIQP